MLYFIYQIRYWKVDQQDTTMKEVMIERQAPKDPRTKRDTPNKDYAILSGLPPYSHLESYVVAMNTFYESNTSNILNFSTPEGGNITWYELRSLIWSRNTYVCRNMKLFTHFCSWIVKSFVRVCIVLHERVFVEDTI